MIYKIWHICVLILCALLVFGCGRKSAEEEFSPDYNGNFIEEGDEFGLEGDVEKNSQLLFEELNMELKKLQAELGYYNESLDEISAQSKLWANPFSIYNKEIILNNGSSIFGKIIYQDQDVMKVETLIGQLIVDRRTIVRVVNNVAAYSPVGEDGETSYTDLDGKADESGINLVQRRMESLSANIVLLGDIIEEKDKSDNTVLSGEVKNIGNKRADFAKIIFTFRMNWQGNTKILTAFINGTTNTFTTGITSDNSVLPHAVGEFELVIPKSFGSFIGYSYEIDWSQYGN